MVGSNNRSVADTTVLTFADSGGRALEGNSAKQFYILSSTPAVTYVCTPSTSADGQNGTGTLKMYFNYALSYSQPTDITAAPLSTGKNAVLADYVSGCSMVAAPARGFAYIRIELLRDRETMSLYHEMRIPKN